MKSAFQKLAIRYGQGNMKFASVDIVLAGIDLLNSIRADLNLGAIPSFYIYENNSLIDTLITCSTTKLNLFLKSHFFGNIKEDDNENRIDHKHSVKFNKEAHRRKSDKDEFNLRSSRKKDDSKDSTSQNSIQKINKIRMDPKSLQMEKRIMTALNANNVDKRITLDFFRSPSPKAKNKARKIIASNGRCQSELSNRSLTPKSRNEFLKKSELSVNRSPSPNVKYKASKKIALSGRCQSELSNRSPTPKSRNEFLKKKEPCGSSNSGPLNRSPSPRAKVKFFQQSSFDSRCHSESLNYNDSYYKIKSFQLKRSQSCNAKSPQFENTTSFNQKNFKIPDQSLNQMEKRIITALNVNNIDKRITMNFFRFSPSPDMLTKANNRFFNPGAVVPLKEESSKEIKILNHNISNKIKSSQLNRTQSYSVVVNSHDALTHLNCLKTFFERRTNINQNDLNALNLLKQRIQEIT